MPANPNICRSCRLGPPHVKMRTIKGNPVGECVPCRNNREQLKRNKSRIYKDFYSFGRALVALNYRTLRGALPGAYRLRHALTKADLGALRVDLRHVLIVLDGQATLYRIDLFGLATFLANQSVEIDSKAFDYGNLDHAATGLTPQDVADKLVIYDLKLREYAIAKVKAEIAEAKRQAQGMPRSNNPSGKAKPKPSE